MTEPSYWSEQAWLPAGIADGVRIEVDAGRITAVTTDTAPRPGDQRLGGLLLPGLANGHSHAFHRALRGRTHDDGGTFWTWRERMYEVARRLDPDRYRRLATAVFAELTLAGYTLVGEFHYLHHAADGQRYPDPNAMGHALLQAARAAGIRITLLDACYLTGGLSPAGHQPLDEVQLRFTDGTAEGWVERWGRLRAPYEIGTERDESTVRIGAAVHSVRAVPLDDLGVVARTAAGHPLHVHLSEQPAENAATQAHYGCSPTVLLDRAGALGPQTTAVHATHVSEADIALLGGSGTTCCVCPTTERDLADGLGPAGPLLAAGSPLTVGSDQHATVDALAEVRELELHERLRTGRRGCFSAAQLLDAAAGAGYASLGWPHGGTLSVGALADFVAVRTDSVRTAGSRPEQILFSATAADVTDVVVGGCPIVRAGAHRLGPVGSLLTAALEDLDS
jgi:formiminoglutamate deiminase